MKAQLQEAWTILRLIHRQRPYVIFYGFSASLLKNHYCLSSFVVYFDSHKSFPSKNGHTIFISKRSAIRMLYAFK